MEMYFRKMTDTERMYTYTQSQQIRMQTGNIGYLRADMDTNGEGFFSNWNGFRDDLKTDEFKNELNAVINALRFDSRFGDVLKNRKALAEYCYSNLSAGDKEMRNFFFRADTDKHSFMLRLNPNKGEYNMYCYCYRKDWLDHHLKSAERGIRFIDPNYNELFRIIDGGQVKLSFPNGTSEEKTCRYIDDYHLDIGSGSMNIFHICEFAERMEKLGARVKPVNEKEIIRKARHAAKTLQR